MTGILVLIVGPSGCGKDTLIAGARQDRRLAPTWSFPQREITRRNRPSAETHIAVSRRTFRQRQAAGHYSLAWPAHDYLYGIPRHMEDDLVGDRSVVVNVSRAVVAEARARFDPLRVIAVTAPRELLRERLRTRNREDSKAIEARLDRSAAFRISGPDVLHLSNAQPKAVAVAQFIDLLKSLEPTRENARSA